MSDTNLLNILLENTTDGVVVLDADGMITHINPSACQLLGISTKDFLNMPQSALIMPLRPLEKDPAHEQALEQFLSHSDTAVINLEIALSRSILASMMIKRLRVDHQSVLLFQVTHEAIQSAMSVTFAEFIGTLRYDLKSYTTSIVGYATVLSVPTVYEKLTHEQLTDFLTIIVKNTRLLETFSHYWDDSFVSLEFGGNTLSRSTAVGGPRRGINDSVKALKNFEIPFLARKDPHLEVITQDNLPEVTPYDEIRLFDMIEHVLKRISHHSPENAVVTLTVGLNADKNAVQFTMRGQGSSFNERELKDLSSWSLLKQGFNKLVWVKQIIEANGGNFWIDVHQEVETSVHFTLPLAAQSPE